MSVNLDPRPGDPFPLTTHLLQKITELERENAALRVENAALKKALDRLEQKFAAIDAKSDKADTSTRKGPTYQTLVSENAALREDKERLDWLEHFIISFSRLTAPDMGGACFVGQYCNSSKDLGKSRQSYLKMEGSTIRAMIDAARKENG